MQASRHSVIAQSGLHLQNQQAPCATSKKTTSATGRGFSSVLLAGTGHSRTQTEYMPSGAGLPLPPHMGHQGSAAEYP